MNRRTMILVSLLGLAAGCAGNKAQPAGPVNVSMPAPAPIPAVPPVKNEPINAALRDSARREIRQAFLSNDPVIRANAIEAAQKTIGLDAHDIVQSGLNDKAPVVRFASTMAAGQLQLKDMHDQLLQLASDADPLVQIGARFALHRIGDVRLSHDLEKTAKSTDARVREQTALVLGRLGEKSALKILALMMNDPDADVRIQVAESMWLMGDEEALQVLVAGSVSKFADDQMYCLQAIAGPKDRRVEPYVRGKLTGPYTEVTLVAARALGELGMDDGYTVAMQSTRSKEARHRFLSALALGAIGRSDAQSSLAVMLKDTEPTVRLAAATAVLELKPPGTAGM